MSKVDLEKAIEVARKLDAISTRTDLDDVRGIVSTAVVSLFQLAEEVDRLRAKEVRVTSEEFDRMRAENARLREALKEVVGAPDGQTIH